MFFSCPKLLRTNKIASFTICPNCGLLMTNSDGKYTKHPMSQGAGKFKIEIDENMPNDEVLLKFPKGQEYKNFRIVNIGVEEGEPK